MIMVDLYTKNDKGEFELVGVEFTGFPSNGVWIVEDGKQNCIYPFENTPEKPTPSLVSYMQYQDELQAFIWAKWKDKALSVNDVSRLSCEFFAIKSGGMKVLGEIIEG